MSTQDALTPAQERDLAIGVQRLREHLLNHAELLFGRLLAAVPGHPPAMHHLGITLFKLGRPAEAIAYLRETTEAEPSAVRWSDLAVGLLRSGDAPGAAEAWRRAGHEGAPPLDAAFSTERGEHPFKMFDYAYTASVRWGENRPSHPGLSKLIGAGRERYRRVLDGLGDIQADLAKVPLGGQYHELDPFWLNVWFPPLDGMALTHMLRAGAPQRFVEIGSGVSTKFARRAVRLYGLPTFMTSIDPEPRNEIDTLCDELVRLPLEACDPAVFDVLEAGDILFLDSSHRCFQGSDVTIFFLEVLPRLRSGVIVHIHDIYLPDDYISGHVRRLWNEQYLLATALLFGDAFEIEFPCWFVGQDPELSAYANTRIRKGELAGVNLYGASFWMRKT